MIDRTARELRDDVAAGRVSAVDVCRASLDRMDAVNPALNAFNHIARDRALSRAQEIDRQRAAGAAPGPLAGVPVVLKDNMCVKGMRTTASSRILDNFIPPYDATVVTRLEAAGAVIVAKANCDEFAMGSSNENSAYGPVRNPWATDRTPGGSSGGASAQVAAGLGQLAVGTDGGGSIRIPCGFTGISGIKANFGRVPAWPLSPMGTVAHVGPMARTVADCALMLNVLARPDPRDWYALPHDHADWTSGLEAGVKGLRIAYSPRLGYVKSVHPEVESRVAAAVRTLARLGATVDQVDPGFADCSETFRVHWTSGAYNALRRLPEKKLALVEAPLVRWFEAGSKWSLEQYLDAVGARQALGEHMRRFHEEWDLLATPALAVPAFEVGRITPAGDAEDWMGWTPFSYPFNLTQQPALSVPCGFTRDGLPVGLQLVAPQYHENLALRAAHAFQQATDHLKRPPL